MHTRLKHIEVHCLSLPQERVPCGVEEGMLQYGADAVMKIVQTFKETALSVLPVMGIVLLFGFTVAPMSGSMLGRFVLGGILLVLGLTVFLQGVALGIQPMGEQCGSALTHRRSLGLLLGAAFVIGFIVTAAEPDIQVFVDQVKGVFPVVKKLSATVAIASGVGVFMVLGLCRTVLNLSIKWTLALSYTALLGVSLLAPSAFIGVAFDSGGATTGPMTVPFIMALGLGVAGARASKSSQDSSFGLTGVASVGPIMAVLVYAITLGTGGALSETAGAAVETAAEPVVGLWTPFVRIAGGVFHEALISIVPLYGLLLLAQVALLRMPRLLFWRMTTGFVYALFGLTVFLMGVHGGFMQAGAELGRLLGEGAVGSAGRFALLIGTGLALGAIIVCAEPAVWVLSEQVEHLSGGAIRRKTLLLFLSIGTALAIGLAMWRAVAGFPLAYLLLPGYVLAMCLMVRTPSLFCGIAFDSGGVASGPLTSTFILSFTLGAASGGAGGTDTFGVIALVAMMPLIAIQFMGILYERARSKGAREHE